MALRRTLSALFTGTVAVWAAFGSAAAPRSRSELLSLVERKVDPERIAAIVRAECVDFDVDAAALAELCPRVPPAALLAAIECRIVNRGSPRAAPAAAAPPPRAPAAEPPV